MTNLLADAVELTLLGIGAVLVWCFSSLYQINLPDRNSGYSPDVLVGKAGC